MSHEIQLSLLCSRFERDIEEMIMKVLAITDPVQKETRTYLVLPFPRLLSFIALTYYKATAEPSSMTTMLKEYELKTKLKPFYPDIPTIDYGLLQWLMSPFYLTREVIGSEITGRPFITVRCSSKTIIKGTTMRDTIAKHLRRQRALTGHITTLRDLIQLLNPDVFHCVFENVIQPITIYSPVLTAIVDVIASSSDPELFVSSIRSFQSRFNITTVAKLKMKTKLYVGRADIRAYYVDLDPIRHLVGSILQTFLLTTRLKLRQQLWTEDWLPALEKNILQKTIRLRQEDHFVISTGDLSSFTNNDVNSWVLCFALVLAIITNESELQKPIVVMVRGEFIEVCLVDVLTVYLVLTMGATSSLPDGTDYIATGGYLGVKANMSLTTMAFAIRLKTIQIQVSDSYPSVTFHGQIGGDDYVLFFYGPSIDDIDSVREIVDDMIQSYVGKAKEPMSMVVINDFPQTLDTPLSFCKKRIWVSILADPYSSDNIATVLSDQKLPYLKEMIEPITSRQPRERLNSLRLFSVQCNRFFDDFSDQEVLVNAYVMSFCSLHNLPGLAMLRYSLFDENAPSSIMIDGIAMTPTVARYVTSFEPIFTKNGLCVTVNTLNRLSILLSREVIELLPQSVSRSSRAFYYAKTEKSLLVRTTCHANHVTESNELSDFIRDCFQLVRTALSHLLVDADV